MKQNNPILNAFTILFETVLCALLYAFFLHQTHLWNAPGAKHSLAIVFITYLFVAWNAGVILFKPKTRQYQLFVHVLKIVLTFFVLNFILLYAADIHVLTRLSKSWFFIALYALAVVYRLLIYHGVRLYRKHNMQHVGVVLVGSTANNQEVLDNILASSMLGCRMFGYFDHQPNPEMEGRCEYLGPCTAVNEYLQAHPDVKHVFCSLPSTDSEVILPIIHYCANHLVEFCSVPDVRNYLPNRLYYNMFGNVPYLTLYDSPLSKPQKRFVKRAFDILFSLTFLLTLFPIIFVVVAVVTTITMPGPIFFVQKRNGLGGKTFRCLKFRSMKVNKDSDTRQATKNDARVTTWGRIMRKTNLDETPQFINVLLGSMSVVGPRPHMQKHTEEYAQLIDKYMMRHLVKPGITGWSQVTGFRGETSELWQMEGRVKGDIWYIEHWNFGLDLFIIFRTVANAVCGDKQAY